MSIVYPNVPNVPGVPPLPRSPLVPPDAPPILLSGDDFLTPPGNPVAQWGIYYQGEPVVLADNVLEMEYKQDWTIADYQMEEGAFESYDKVSNPFRIQLAFSRGGSVGARQNFINSISSIAGDLNQYDVYTPEVNYTNCNIEHYDYRRQATNGMGLITVYVTLVQVRVTVQPVFSNVKNVGSNAQFNDGVAQPSTITDTNTETVVVNATRGGGG